MYSNADLERFYFQYQTESLPHGESLQSFCLRNKVPYNIFEKWYKDTRKKVVEVQVDVFPSGDKDEQPAVNPQKPTVGAAAPIRIRVDLRMSNGLHLSRKNLSYQELVRMIEKLEGLC